MLEEKRWGYNPICPRCRCEKVYLRSSDRGYVCADRECRLNFNVFYGTILSNTKLNLNLWYDIAIAYRNNNKLSTHFFSNKFGLTQKTTWWMLRKLKTNPLLIEHDVPILHILLTPAPFTSKTYISNKPTPEEYHKRRLKTLSQVYPKDSNCFMVLKTVINLIKTDYNGDVNSFCTAYNTSLKMLYRYMNGTRMIPIKKAIELNNAINDKAMLQYENLLEYKTA